MSYKEDFWNAIDEELPESISELLDVTLNASGVTAPADTDSAIIETGKLAAKLNAILDSLDGLSLVELALRIGQKNVTSKLMLLAALEYAGASTGEGETAQEAGFDVLAPKEGKEYDAWIFPFQVQRLDKTITSITCRVDDALDVELTRDGDLFSGAPQQLLHPGQHLATFTGSNEKSVSINFSIADIEIMTIPVDGGSVVGPVVQISAAAPDAGENIAAVTCSLAGRMFTLMKDGASGVYKATVDFATFSAEELPNLAATTATFMVELSGSAAEGAGNIIEKIVNFGVTSPYGSGGGGANGEW